MVAASLVLATGVGCATTPEEPAADVVAKAEARRDLGLDHLRNGRTAMAIRELEYALTLDPEDRNTLLGLGEAYRRKGHLERAEDLCRRALRLDPEFHETRLQLSALYLQMKRYEDAIRHSQELIRDPIFSTPWRALTNRGWAEFKLGRTVDARQSLLQALDFHPNYSTALLNLGILENEEGHRLEALQLFQRVLEQNPGYGAQAEVNYRMGEVYVTLGRLDKALHHFAVAVERAPHAHWGKQSQQYLQLLRP